MSRQERYGTRSLAFSKWHRSLSDQATCIDLDFLEYCDACKRPLALIEIAQDVGQHHKPTTILRSLAERARIPAFLILYKLDPSSEHGIGNCRVARIWKTQTWLKNRTLKEVGKLIERIHSRCPCKTTISQPKL